MNYFSTIPWGGGSSDPHTIWSVIGYSPPKRHQNPPFPWCGYLLYLGQKPCSVSAKIIYKYNRTLIIFGIKQTLCKKDFWHGKITKCNSIFSMLLDALGCSWMVGAFGCGWVRLGAEIRCAQNYMNIYI